MDINVRLQCIWIPAAAADWTKLQNFVVDVGWYFSSDPGKFTTTGYTRCTTRVPVYEKGDALMTSTPERLYCTASVLGQYVVLQLLDAGTYFASCDVGIQGRFYGSMDE